MGGYGSSLRNRLVKLELARYVFLLNRSGIVIGLELLQNQPEWHGFAKTLYIKGLILLV